ncbi:MAG: peptidylprolyl isomerase [Dokdonella sp.]
MAISGCSSGGGSSDGVIDFPPNQPVVEIVNGQQVPQALLDAFARGRRMDLSKPDQYEKALAELTEYVLLAQEAKRKGYPSAPKYQALIEISRLQGVASSTLSEMQDSTDVDESVLHKEYENQIAAAGSVEYDITQLIFATEAEALKAAGDMVSGQTLQQVYLANEKTARQARAYSHVRLDQLPAALATALRNLKTDQTTRVPVQTQFGWHIVHVDSTRALTPPAFETVRDSIHQTLIAQMAKDRIAKLREEATIKLIAAAPTAPAASSQGTEPTAKAPAQADKPEKKD